MRSVWADCWGDSRCCMLAPACNCGGCCCSCRCCCGCGRAAVNLHESFLSIGGHDPTAIAGCCERLAEQYMLLHGAIEQMVPRRTQRPKATKHVPVAVTAQQKLNSWFSANAPFCHLPALRTLGALWTLMNDCCKLLHVKQMSDRNAASWTDQQHPSGGPPKGLCPTLLLQRQCTASGPDCLS
jgi:hypothetical protein